MNKYLSTQKVTDEECNVAYQAVLREPLLFPDQAPGDRIYLRHVGAVVEIGVCKYLASRHRDSLVIPLSVLVRLGIGEKSDLRSGDIVVIPRNGGDRIRKYEVKGCSTGSETKGTITYHDVSRYFSEGVDQVIFAETDLDHTLGNSCSVGIYLTARPAEILDSWVFFENKYRGVCMAHPDYAKRAS